MNKFIIGIDLGTTNCTLAYAEVPAKKELSDLVQFPIRQLIEREVEGESLSLPSFLYFPLEEEKIEGSYCLGTFARDRGAQLPDRLVSSAKSWLCHEGVDRRAPILPPSEARISPLEVSSALLSHLKAAWETANPKVNFAEQTVLVTVPASFDPSARQLVQEAAKLAGYPEGTILLEEPQAAFYSWLQVHEKSWRSQLKLGDLVLVVDIGGGTTDFSLIAVKEKEGDLELERIAVGAHLLLGGDNMDWALAYKAREKLEAAGHNIDDWQLNTLVHICRKAKEQLLSKGAPKSADILIPGRGKKLVGGGLKTTLTQKEALEILVEGFIPLLPATERSAPEARLGLQQVGLPYAQDPRLSAQLARFLAQAGADGKLAIPTALLFNGGALKAEPLRARIEEQLNSWAKEEGKNPVKVLSGTDCDYAVSHGAVSYGFARLGHAVRIKSGTSRSYFIGVEDAVPAIPGVARGITAFCIAPLGMEEGSEARLPNKEFHLLLGEKAQFRFFSSDATVPLGTAVRRWQKELQELHPIEAVLERQEEEGRTVAVTLKSAVTELGVLEIYCQASNGRLWKLEFNLPERHAAALTR